MADVDNINKKEISGLRGFHFVRAQLTGATSTYTSPFGASTKGVIVQEEGTNGATYTWSTTTGVITITGTNNDWVNMMMWAE